MTTQGHPAPGLIRDYGLRANSGNSWADRVGIQRGQVALKKSCGRCSPASARCDDRDHAPGWRTTCKIYYFAANTNFRTCGFLGIPRAIGMGKVGACIAESR